MQIDTQANVIQALEAGRADAAVVDVSTVKWLVKRHPDNYADPGKPGEAQLYGAAVRQGDLDWLHFRHQLQRRHVRPRAGDLDTAASRTSSARSRRVQKPGFPPSAVRSNRLPGQGAAFGSS